MEVQFWLLSGKSPLTILEMDEGHLQRSPPARVVNLLLGRAFLCAPAQRQASRPHVAYVIGMGEKEAWQDWGWREGGRGWESHRDLQHSDENPVSASAIAGPL